MSNIIFQFVTFFIEYLHVFIYSWNCVNSVTSSVSFAIYIFVIYCSKENDFLAYYTFPEMQFEIKWWMNLLESVISFYSQISSNSVELKVWITNSFRTYENSICHCCKYFSLAVYALYELGIIVLQQLE